MGDVGSFAALWANIFQSHDLVPYFQIFRHKKQEECYPIRGVIDTVVERSKLKGTPSFTFELSANMHDFGLRAVPALVSGGTKSSSHQSYHIFKDK